MTFLLGIGAAGVAWSAMVKQDAAETLLKKYEALGAQLRQNQFKRPLVLDSVESMSRLKGDIFSIVEYPFAAVSAGLNNPDHWCDVMILHINTKYCHAVTSPAGTILRVNVGKKTPEPLADAQRIEFDYRVAVVSPEYIEIMLNANEGPMGTSDYRIQLEAVALPNARTFLHLTYSYVTSFTGRLAMRTYLATVGRDKVGFTVVGKKIDGQLDYIGGVRGVMERNTMRYYLAIEAFLASTREVPSVQLDKRLQSWFTAVERYPRQLNEMDRNAYLQMKRAEHVRQQTVQ